MFLMYGSHIFLINEILLQMTVAKFTHKTITVCLLMKLHEISSHKRMYSVCRRWRELDSKTQDEGHMWK